MRRRYTGLSRRSRIRSPSRAWGDGGRPLVSVLIRTRNRPTFLREAVESVVAQEYRPIEVVVVNDGGDDPSPLLASLDLRGVSLKLVNLPRRRGRSFAANRAFEESSGKYVNFLDDDDILLPEHVSTLVGVLEKQRRRIAYTACEMVEMEMLPDGTWRQKKEVLRRFSTPFDENRILFENFIPFMTLMMDREAFEWVGGVDESFEIYEDWDLIIRLSERYTPLHIPRVTALYRVHSEGGVGDARTSDDLWRWTERVFVKHREKLSPERLCNHLRWVIGLKMVRFEGENRSLLAKVEDLERTVRSLREENRGLKERCEALDTEKRVLSAKAASLEARVGLLQAERNALQRYRDAVESTLGWRLLVKLRRMRDGLLPQGSVRRALLWDGWTALLKGRDRKEKIKKGVELLKTCGIKGSWRHLRSRIQGADSYKTWILLNTPDEKMLSEMKKEAKSWESAPRISVIMPVYKTPVGFLRRAIESVVNQAYPFWELCIADDGSADPEVERVLREYEKRDSRITVRFLPENRGISAASNEALRMATGDFVALLDHDDELAPHALYRVAEVIRERPEIDMVYSDEDKLAPNGERCEPFFKPDWSPDLLLSQMYTCHLGVYRRRILEEIGGFRSDYDGSQDYDMVLRFTERTERIHHIPDILYHWRMVPGSCAGDASAKPFAQDAGRRALEDALRRRGIKGRVLPGFSVGMYRVKYEIAEPNPRVSIIIPNRDHVDMLGRCIDSLLSKTDYRNYEVVVVENGSRESATFEYYERLAEEERVRVIEYPEREFNFSAINNWAVERAKGDMVLFLNNDTEVISPEWLGAMVEHAQRREVGAVGGLLLFPDDTIQHAGVILGIGGVASHSHMWMRKELMGYFGRPHLIHNLSAVTAACMLMRREVFEEVGGFDEENLPVAFNDVDLCLRIRERGYWIVYTPYAELYHHESVSRGRDDVYSDRFRKEIELMRERWGPQLDKDPFYNPNLSLEAVDFSVRV